MSKKCKSCTELKEKIKTLKKRVLFLQMDCERYESDLEAARTDADTWRDKFRERLALNTDTDA